jgi:N-acetylneuraminate synthase/N,N'-diacetyllegionaminate synthase
VELVTIGNHRLGGDQPFVIAEAGVNHDGDVATAHALIEVAAQAGAGSVKFQTFEASSLVAEDASATPYQQRATGSSSQSQMLQALSLPRTAWRELSDHAAELDLLFLSTPFDLASADLLLELGVPALKVPSGELTNLEFIRRLAALKVPLLISTGMGSLEEVGSALEAASAAPSRALFHCVSAYPAPAEDCNLLAIPAMADTFDVPVGWSDHTAGSTAAVASAALGARIFEKHFTLDSTAAGPDHAASLEPDELASYIRDIDVAVRMLGDGRKRRMPSEFENAPLVRRSWHARRDLPAGHLLTDSDVIALRPETGVSVSVDIVGRSTTRPTLAGEAIAADSVAIE